MEPNHRALLERIAELKRRKNAVVLAHYYTRPEVQAAADFLGDSLALSVKARDTDAEVILFAGVHFMAQTAKVLCPGKRVLDPAPEAGCSLADGCEAEDFARFLKDYPGHTVVSYVNTSVGVKALTDICCTSSNALKVVESIPADRPVVFGPDRNLGDYIRRRTGRTNMVLWDGACRVHEAFSLAGLRRMREEHPAARVVAHPECPAPLLAEADYCGSTAGILDYCRESDAGEFIVVTEPGILARMRELMPGKLFLPAPGVASPCNECADMKLVTLERIAECLENGSPEVVIDEPTRAAAERSILNMIAIR